MTKPTIAEVRERFARYHDMNSTWGSLHVVLEDENVLDRHVRGCIEWARDHDDAEGAALGEILLRMSITQRRKLAYV